MAKKVLLTIGTLYGGGAERVVSLWANQLSEVGYDVSVLLFYRTENEYPVSDRVHVHTIGNDQNSYVGMGHMQKLRAIRQTVQRVKPQTVINFLPRMQIMMLAATAGMGLFRVETVRVNPWIILSDNTVERRLWKMCFHMANRILVQTPEQGEFFSKRLRKKCVVIPNPVSERYMDAYKQDHSAKVERFVAAGRIAPQKNYPMMIRAFGKAREKCPGIKLSIYGTGEESYLQQLKALVRQLDLEDVVTFEGRSNEMHRELCCRDAFLMTSDYEGMPNALLEAMAVGLVCISTNCKTGPKDMITPGENGLLVDTGDVDAAAEAIIRVVSMGAAQREEMGSRARETILTLCSPENSLRRLEALVNHT